MGDTNYAEVVRSYIETNTNLQVDREKGNWLKIHGSNIRIYLNASKHYYSDSSGWYDLSENTYDEFLNDKSNEYFNFILLGDTNTIFIIPRHDFLRIFDKKFMTKPKEWMFNIFNRDGKYILKFTNLSDQHEITKYLNKLDLFNKEVENIKVINNDSKLENKDVKQIKEKPTIFVTGYSNKNLNHSLRNKILGWKNQSHILSPGDYVFVYNNDSHFIQTAFKVVAESNNKEPIWEEEVKSSTNKLVFPYRWDVEVIQDNLQIGLSLIGTFEPFIENATQKFIPLVGNNFPTPLSDKKYSKFCNFLLEQDQNPIKQMDNKFQRAYWKIAPGEQASQWEEQLTNKVIAIGWNEIGDLSNRNTNEITEDIKKNYPDSSNAVIPQFNDFLSVKEGDIVVANKGFSKIVGIGRIIGDYKYRPDLTFSHTYPVEWFDTTERNISPQKGIWRKTVSRISQQLYEEIIYYLLIRHQPEFKRTKSEREYWNDLLGKEYHFGKNVINYKKITKDTRTIWFYTDSDKLYLWGYGEVTEVTPPANNKNSIAMFSDFKFFDANKSATELEPSLYNKIKSLDSWNPYNSIIEINKEIYDEILKNQLQLQIFDGDKLQSKSYDDLKAFIENHKKNENYQPVVIKELTENPSGLTKQQIQNQLRVYNLESESKSMTETVLSVLLNNQIIKKVLDKYVLNINHQLNNDEKNNIINLCDIRIKEFLDKLHINNQKLEYEDFSAPNLDELKHVDKNNILGEDSDLPFPSATQIKKAIEEIQKELFIDENTIKEIIYNLLSGKNILLAGPIGTGKTHLAKLIPELVWQKYDNGYYPEVVTATSEWTTTEVIGGIYPNSEDSKISYSFVDGCITKTLKLNWYDKTCQSRKKYSKDNETFRGIWLIIDEFNRANIDRCFGEMFTSLEYKELTLLNGNKVIIPKDYRIIATLNVFDKHYLFRMSDALKRRFAYIEIFPNFTSKNFDEEMEKYYAVFRALNDLFNNTSFNTNFSNEKKIVLDHKGKIIDKDQSDKEFINIIESCYLIFKFIRYTKNLGTGILIAIIKYILVGSLKYNEELDYLLDVALKSNIIPQLETTQKASLQTLLYFCEGKIGNLFKNKKLDDIDFKMYQIEFSKLSKYFNYDQTLEVLNQNNNVNWESYNPWSGRIIPTLPLFVTALSELIENNDMV